ncbi:MAG: FAD-binding oxidoreductase, partial [Pedobacter sp.]
MNYKKVDLEFLNQIKIAVGAENVFTDEESLEKYCHDETEDLRYHPEVVVKPNDPTSIAALLKLCNDNHVPVTPRGGGTGLSGAALPIYGGVLLSMEKFKSIIEVDIENLQATVEPGVITEEFINAVAEHGLLYPVDPSSKGSCFIGGNVAHGSGGPRVVKYGTIREYIVNLEVVLADGSIIWTGANTLKYASG